jgi:hypothetical protein
METPTTTMNIRSLKEIWTIRAKRKKSNRGEGTLPIHSEKKSCKIHRKSLWKFIQILLIFTKFCGHSPKFAWIFNSQIFLVNFAWFFLWFFLSYMTYETLENGKAAPVILVFDCDRSQPRFVATRFCTLFHSINNSYSIV